MKRGRRIFILILITQLAPMSQGQGGRRRGDDVESGPERGAVDQPSGGCSVNISAAGRQDKGESVFSLGSVETHQPNRGRRWPTGRQGREREKPGLTVPAIPPPD
ncbi:hypothetical protein B0H63DRAFT_207878 [Podospora didyma]|uniref:Secreted protein n=1 Tax=Podospora didyma TaxID=330526 RepID=A0AAE0NHB4_9PEZI|nr:hypothetical protein B0H63DRAFT_207878 [Podospora didyma]